MESYGHGQIPRRGRMAPRHYSDSKAIRMHEIPSTPDRDGDPELIALHTEFKIQRERLASWGQEWGNDRTTTGEAELDEVFERSELQGTVGDVLENVRKVLEESERISQVASSTPKGEKRTPFWALNTPEQKWNDSDRAKYEQLADELKASIDLLYDISKNRRELKESGYPGFAGKSKSESSLPPPISNDFFPQSSFSVSEETLINPTRSSTQKTAASLDLPPRLDLSSLQIPADEPPPYDAAGATPTTRMIGHYKLPAPPSQSSDGESTPLLMPVLIEYCPFDASYRTTGVSVPTNRLDSFMNFYARCGSLADFRHYSTLSCLGFFEDSKQARFGLVYELPKTAVDLEKSNGATIDSRPVSLHKVLQSASKLLNSNRQVPPGPPLEDRFRLAFNLVQAFSKFHLEEKLLHKDVNSSNILFFLKPISPQAKSHEYNIRSPFISSFDLFSEYNIEEDIITPGRNLYRHPQDPKVYTGKCEFCDKSICQCAKYRFDTYGLGLVLLEIGLWGPLSDIFKPKYSLEDFRRRLETVWVRKLATRCGSIYQSVVKDCLQQASQDLSEQQMRENYDKWLKKLQRCCLLDEEEDPPSLSTTPTRAASRVHSISGAPASISPESSITAGEVSNNPFLNLHAKPAGKSTSSFFKNPFASFTKKSLPFSIKEESDNNPYGRFDDLSTVTSREFNSTIIGSELENTSTSSSSVRYSNAARTIQKAWRRYRAQGGFQEYKRKVVVIQKAWRRRQERRRSLSTQGLQRDIEEVHIETTTVTDYTRIQITQHHTPAKPKLRLHTVKLLPELLDEWHDLMLPKLEKICERCLRDSPETVSIDLLGVGETALSAKPTIFVTCSSTSRVKGALNRKFHYDASIFDLKVRKGRIRRSKAQGARRSHPAHRSMMNGDYDESVNDRTPLNPFHQERPLCGASIGAYVDGKHLPPVSYGGVIEVDGEPFGMTVHHLLDTPSDEDDSEFDEQEQDAYAGAERSSARRNDAYDSMLFGMAGHPTLQSIPTDSMFPLEISDDEPPSSDEEDAEDEVDLSDSDGYESSDFESEPESIATTSTKRTLGDLSGILPGQGTRILVTQPALDDIDTDFFPSEEDRDDDHLSSHKLGCVYASSGIRRWNRPIPNDEKGRSIVHEIDWALLTLDSQRLQPWNLIQGGRKHTSAPPVKGKRTKQDHPIAKRLLQPICRAPTFKPRDDEYPTSIACSASLGNLPVHCIGRTSGLASGTISPAMSSVRIYRRRSFSRSWHVIGTFGVGGDSGAWVITEKGEVAGHVLAWCERNRVCYICPMEVLVEDIARTLGAKRVSLPGCDDDDSAELTASSSSSSAGTARPRQERQQRSPLALPDIARLDFGDRERLGLGGSSPAEDIMRRSAASAALKGLERLTVSGGGSGAGGEGGGRGRGRMEFQCVS